MAPSLWSQYMNYENSVVVILTQYFWSLRFVKLSDGNQWPWAPRNEIGGYFDQGRVKFAGVV